MSSCVMRMQKAASAPYQTAVWRCCSNLGWGAPQRHECGHWVEVKAGAALQHLLITQRCRPGETSHLTGSPTQLPAADVEHLRLWSASLPDCSLAKS